MKKSLFTIFLFLLTGFALQAQSKKAFSAGEWFKFRIHYGPFNASYATLEVDETSIQGEPVYHIKGRGKSTGLLHWFFKVDIRLYYFPLAVARGEVFRTNFTVIVQFSFMFIFKLLFDFL